ncbi:MAG TPA: S4 domain-containing protein [Polyangia bacterium]
MRLQTFLAHAGVSSRRRAEALIASGAVRVNGVVVNTLGTNVAERDRVEVDGRRVTTDAPVYRLLLKPRACLATLAPSGARPTLARYLRDAEPGWQVAAPLDFPAEGVVLVTSDGPLAQAIARSKVSMTYHVKLQGLIGDNDVERLARGWRWEGRPVKPTSVEQLAVTEKNSWVEMVVAEARPRALKAGGDVIRHSVLKLARVRLGGLSFEGLKMGDWRDLTKAEIADLRKRAGLEK